MRSFSISSSREQGIWWAGSDALAAAAATAISSASISDSLSPLGVPVLISGASTAMLLSLPARFSLPPTRGGRMALAALPDVAANSGVAESLRLSAATMDVRGRFWPATDLGWVAAFGADAEDCFWPFFGASGCGHSTSWERSSREPGTHSVRLLDHQDWR